MGKKTKEKKKNEIIVREWIFSELYVCVCNCIPAVSLFVDVVEAC